jgi:hypothetical protein
MATADEPLVSPATLKADERSETIVDVLRASILAEALAEGSARRVAFRTTRHLFAGAVQLGLSHSRLAARLAVSTGAVRSRSTMDGLVAAEAFAERADVSEHDIDTWRDRKWIRLGGPDMGGTIGYQASTLLTALLQHHERQG